MLAEGETNASHRRAADRVGGHGEDAREAHPPQARGAQPVAGGFALLPRVRGGRRCPVQGTKITPWLDADGALADESGVALQTSLPSRVGDPPTTDTSEARSAVDPDRRPAPVDRRTDQGRARQRSGARRAARGRAAHRRDGDHLRRRQHRRHAGAGRGAGRGRATASSSLLHQARQRRICGLGAAVVQGIRAARAPWVCVMDADLQHPPELIAALLEQGESRELDIVVASRYCDGGDANSFGWMRAMASRSTTTARAPAVPAPAAQRERSHERFLPRPPRGARPRRAAAARLQDPARDPRAPPAAARGRGVLRVRRAATPAGARLRSARACATSSACSRGLRFARFGLVGLSGLVVNTLLLGVPHRRRGALLRRLGGDRHAGLDAVELLLHRGVGVLGQRPPAQPRAPGWPCSS